MNAISPWVAYTRQIRLNAFCHRSNHLRNNNNTDNTSDKVDVIRGLSHGIRYKGGLFVLPL